MSAKLIILNHYNISGSSTAPSWVQIDASTGQLIITAPGVYSDSNFSFYIVSFVSGISISAQKLITLTVLKCQVQNWQKCSSYSALIWSTQSSGNTQSSNSTLNSESLITASNTSQKIRVAFISTLGVSLWMVTIVSLINPASTTSLWSMINHAQMLLLLLITRAFIPLDIQNVILGAKFTLNVASYFSFHKIKLFESVIEEFDIKLSNQSLELLGINSKSSIYNIYPVVILALLIIPIHFLILFLYILMPTEAPEGRWKFIKRVSIKLVNRLFAILTFGWYIRYILETNQYVLISWINEVYSFTISDSQRTISLLFSILVSWLCLCLIICVSLLSLSSYEVIKNKHNKVGEIFNGVKMMKRNKLYVPILLMRRAICVILLTLVCKKNDTRCKKMTPLEFKKN